jgi:hypothetical protein
MADPLEMFGTSGLDAVYDVVRTVEVIVHHELYRIRTGRDPIPRTEAVHHQRG